MPMVYISKETLDILKRVELLLKQKTKPPNRILRVDILRAALETYLEKLREEGEEK